MADYTVVNLRDDVEDMAPKFGHSPDMESRSPRKNLEMENGGPDTELEQGFWG